MDYLANINHVGLSLSKNPIVVNLDALSPITYPVRVGLRYYLEMWTPEFSGASTYKKLTTLEGSEAPPETSAGATAYPGANFELQEILHTLLESCVPDFGLAKIALCSTLTSPYYVTAIRKNGAAVVDSTVLPSSYVYRGGVNPRHYADYKDSFFTSYVGAGRRFLTWKMNYAPVREDQPEYLHFLTNFTPVPSQLKLRAQVFYTDGTQETLTIMSTTEVVGMGVYIMPVGPKAMGLLSLAKTVSYYVVWVSNQDDARLSEERTYRIDRTPIKQVRYLLFQNSLGVYDTLACTGDGVEMLKVERQTSERFTGYDYLPTSAETIINRVTGERQLNINFGFPKFNGKKWREYWQEVILSEQTYLVTDRAHIPLQPVTDTYMSADDNEQMISRGMVYRYSNEERSYSVLPPVVAVSRATGWRGDALSCELDASTGLRNGKKRYELLVKYYLDNGTDVKPFTQKANLPGTVGYIPPWSSSDCLASTTPYKNTLRSQSSVLRRSNCSGGQVGTLWTIIIPANTYGSEINQADADAKAEAAAALLDTQANADTNGGCIVPTAIPVGLTNACTDDPTHPVFALIVGGAEIITNTSFNSPTVRYAGTGLNAGTYSFDIRVQYSNTPFQEFRIRIPSKGFDSGPLAGNQTYRIGNIVVAWGDADLIIICEPT